MDTFNLLIHLGNLIHNKDSISLNISINEVKKILSKKHSSLSHSELFIDLLSPDSPRLFNKLREALIKDLKIEVVKDETKTSEDIS